MEETIKVLKQCDKNELLKILKFILLQYSGYIVEDTTAKYYIKSSGVIEVLFDNCLDSFYSIHNNELLKTKHFVLSNIKCTDSKGIDNIIFFPSTNEVKEEEYNKANRDKKKEKIKQNIKLREIRIKRGIKKLEKYKQKLEKLLNSKTA